MSDAKSNEKNCKFPILKGILHVMKKGHEYYIISGVDLFNVDPRHLNPEVIELIHKYEDGIKVLFCPPDPKKRVHTPVKDVYLETAAMSA